MVRMGGSFPALQRVGVWACVCLYSLLATLVISLVCVGALVPWMSDEWKGNRIRYHALVETHPSIVKQYLGSG